MSIKIKVSAEEILAGKFRKTIESLNGYLQEARGDRENGTSWSAKAVYLRLTNLREAFDHDLKGLAEDLDLSGDDVGEISKKLDQINGTLQDGVAVKTNMPSGPR